MTASQLTRVINWVAMLIALLLLALVSYHIYQRHFVQLGVGQNYQFDDLPGASEAPVTADIQQIIDKHIFGEVPAQPKQVIAQKPKPQPKPAPKTKLNITLTGIIDGANSDNGMAMLEVERGRTIVVSVGDKIGKTDATLHQVLPGEILIDRGGAIESVKMVRKTLTLASLDEMYNTVGGISRGNDQPIDTLPQPSDTLPPPTETLPQPSASSATSTQIIYDPDLNQGSYQPPARAERRLPPNFKRASQPRNIDTTPKNKLPIPRALQTQ